MRAILVLLFLLAVSVAGTAESRTTPTIQPGEVACRAGGSSAPPAGWGRDCTNWIQFSDPWNSGELCYDPLLGAGGAGWRVCSTGEPVVWPDLEIELWIEMECVITWDRTHAKIHRASDYSDFVLEFNGTSQCNNGQWIVATPPSGLTTGLEWLPFVQDMFGRAGSLFGTDVALEWEYRGDGNGWAPMEDNIALPGSKMFPIEACDHSFTIRITGDLKYHQEDGYYYLGGPGCAICLTEPL